MLSIGGTIGVGGFFPQETIVTAINIRAITERAFSFFMFKDIMVGLPAKLPK
jgi:hypothetical protein